MKSYADKNHAKRKSGMESYSKQQQSDSAAFQFVDNCTASIAQRKLSAAINASPKQVAQRQQLNNLFGHAVQLQAMDEDELQMKTDTGPLQRLGEEEEELLQGQFKTVQRQGDLEEDELLQGKFTTAQRQENLEDDELVQGKFGASPIQRQQDHTPNNTGLPDNFKAGIENLSGYSMDDVSVHYNSPKPTQVQAHAYAQGTDIHLASGQEKHLPHEAWHVVQQKQGRVKPTLQLQTGTPVNDDPQLEKEADVMGTRSALQYASKSIDYNPKDSIGYTVVQRGGAVADPNAPKNYNAIGYGIQGINTLTENVGKAEDPACKVGVMTRYPVGWNYYKGKGGHTALQVDVDLKDQSDHQYLQVGVSATGSIQVEPRFQTIKTRPGYNIKRITKDVEKPACVNVLKKTAAEIATDQPYKERIYFNTGSKTNCSLWASAMAEHAGINLGVSDKWFLPSPNDVQKLMENLRGKDGMEITDKTEVEEGNEIDTNVGVEAAPGWDEVKGEVTGVIDEERARELMEQAKNRVKE